MGGRALWGRRERWAVRSEAGRWTGGLARRTTYLSSTPASASPRQHLLLSIALFSLFSTDIHVALFIALV